MAPHLDRWHQTWSAKGLVVIEVELGLATPLEALREDVERRRVVRPVLHDGVGEVTARYDVHGFPTAVVIDRSGRVVWHGAPSRDPESPERAIRRALGA